MTDTINMTEAGLREIKQDRDAFVAKELEGFDGADELAIRFGISKIIEYNRALSAIADGEIEASSQDNSEKVSKSVKN